MIDQIAGRLSGYWTDGAIAANINVVFNVIGALLLGLMVGYERSYRGRAAGMRTYGLVCMASCALTAVCGTPGEWFGGQGVTGMGVDPSRVIQGIVTGIGFLGAGVIMRDGLNISGLTTAASIWVVSAIGIMVGLGLYAAAILQAAVATGFMLWGGKLEGFLPARHAISITLHFSKDTSFTEDALAALLDKQGYEFARGSFSVQQRDGRSEWRFVAVSLGRKRGATLVRLGNTLMTVQGIQDFHIAHARN